MQAGIEAARVAAPKIRAAVERWVALHAGRS
jgi:hypothetical protein